MHISNHTGHWRK